MHKFLRAAGFSMYTKKKDIEKLLDLLERQPSMTKCVQVDEDSNVCEMRTEVAPFFAASIRLLRSFAATFAFWICF